jgi:hypothetical protein
MEGISRILPCGSLLVKEFPKQRNVVRVYEGRQNDARLLTLCTRCVKHGSYGHIFCYELTVFCY